MAVATFAAIDVGSYELELTIYEISPKKGIAQLNRVRKVIGLGRDTYDRGIISYDRVDEMCKLLSKFKGVMAEFQVDGYKAYGTSAIREAENREVVLDQIKVRTGLEVEVLSNSEQRFLCYKAIAAKENEFNNIIQKGTAIAEVGSGSMQISVFDKDALVTTQNLQLGALRIHQILAKTGGTNSDKKQIIQELIDNDIQTFKKLFLKEREVKNIIATGVCALYMGRGAHADKQRISVQEFQEFYQALRDMSEEQIAEKYDIPAEFVALIVPGAMVYKKLIEITGAEMVWLPGVRLGDGIAAEYAEQKKLLRFPHDFSQDILVAARNIAKRYMSDKEHSAILEKNVLNIFDSMRKYHGLGKRERLLLQISTILHDCGKYISMRTPGECAYNIIMSTEIIGVSHKEREIIANVVKYNTMEFDYTADSYTLNKDMRIIIAKLTAILKIGNAMDRSHKQKFKDIRVSIKDQQMFLTTDSSENIMLEESLFKQKADFFEEVYGIRPVLRKKKGI
ncbi:Ppx/GppA phosphatase family protein [Qiania dongpingensis]|uniref:Exopolyphosphatase n=1 Tax=Qiania dongpingensis TaxID=2763669 RepID=A0A7G9G303_9FIRM|nr:exopolyphosphatase [Qiania dongpingensis]QNM05185.1 exopolyphosphatase [Qiania dongpingensis]